MELWPPLSRLALRAEDTLRYSPAARAALCRTLLAAERALPIRDGATVSRRLSTLIKATVKAPTPELMAELEECVRAHLRRIDFGRIDWASLYPNSEERAIRKAVILKPPSGSEKGVLFLSYEFQLVRVLRYCDLGKLAERYDVVFSPSYSPPHNLVVFLFPELFPGTIYSLISHQAELEILPRISPRYRVVPLLASSWVNPEVFSPRPFAERDIDVLMVAGFSKAKRHFAFFEALAQIPPPLRVTLIGQADGGRGSDDLRREAALYGVSDRFVLIENPLTEFAPANMYASVVQAMCRARTSLIFSRQEGSCIVVAESMFANTPVGLLADAWIGSKAFINPATGRLLDPARLGAEIKELVDHAHELSPRAWAEEHISCYKSTEILNRTLREHALSEGRPWTVDLAPLTWCPAPKLVREEDRLRMKPAYEAFERELGIAIQPLEQVQ